MSMENKFERTNARLPEIDFSKIELPPAKISSDTTGKNDYAEISKKKTIELCRLVRRVGDVSDKPQIWELSKSLGYFNNVFRFRFKTVHNGKIITEVFKIDDVVPIINDENRYLLDEHLKNQGKNPGDKFLDSMTRLGVHIINRYF